MVVYPPSVATIEPDTTTIAASISSADPVTHDSRRLPLPVIAQTVSITIANISTIFVARGTGITNVGFVTSAPAWRELSQMNAQITKPHPINTPKDRRWGD